MTIVSSFCFLSVLWALKVIYGVHHRPRQPPQTPGGNVTLPVTLFFQPSSGRREGLQPTTGLH